MYEKVNPSHPDKVADRIAGAIVDYCYEVAENPTAAVEVLLGHGQCCIIAEGSVELTPAVVKPIVHRIIGASVQTHLRYVPQDIHLAANQKGVIRCGDNGIFRGAPVTREQARLAQVARRIYANHPSDGKYIINGDKLTICQSNTRAEVLRKDYPDAIINPIGDWTGGPNVDAGATNRKLGSDMGDGVTGGGLHGKDLSKADVSVNIYCHILAQQRGKDVQAVCSIGDESVGGVAYADIVKVARDYIDRVGGFEKFAEWGLI